MISPDWAKNTAHNTSQRGIRTVMNPHMSLRYRTIDWMLRYPHLPHLVFNDTRIDGTVSMHGNNNAQVYGTSFGYTFLFPVELNSYYHETLTLFFKYDGVLPKIIIDNSKEELSSNFVRSYVRLTAIRKRSNPTRFVAQPLK